MNFKFRFPNSELWKLRRRYMDAAMQAGGQYTINGYPALYSRHTVLNRMDQEPRGTVILFFWFLTEVQTPGGILIPGAGGRPEQAELGPFLVKAGWGSQGNLKIQYAPEIQAQSEVAWEALDRRVARAAKAKYQSTPLARLGAEAYRKEYTKEA